jgi:hypothetical protein
MPLLSSGVHTYEVTLKIAEVHRLKVALPFYLFCSSSKNNNWKYFGINTKESILI